jgi:hypothetical protein
VTYADHNTIHGCPQTWLAVALSSQGPSSHGCLRETSCASHPPSQGLAPLERGGAGYGWPWIDVCSIWRRTWLFPLLFLYHRMNAFIHVSNLSAAALAPSQKQTRQQGSHSWMPGWRRRTKHPQGQPPTWFCPAAAVYGACLPLPGVAATPSVWLWSAQQHIFVRLSSSLVTSTAAYKVVHAASASPNSQNVPTMRSSNLPIII